MALELSCNYSNEIRQAYNSLVESIEEVHIEYVSLEFLLPSLGSYSKQLFLCFTRAGECPLSIRSAKKLRRV